MDFGKEPLTVEGAVLSGRVVGSLPAAWPKGSRVSVALLQEDDLDAELAAMPVPPETETREEFLGSLRQAAADINAGASGSSVEEAFARVDAELRKLAETGNCKP